MCYTVDFSIIIIIIITWRAFGRNRAHIPVALSTFHSRWTFQIKSRKTRYGYNFAVHKLCAFGNVQVRRFQFGVETVRRIRN